MREVRRTGALALLATVVIGLAGLLLVAAIDDRRLAFTLGVRPTQVVAVLEPGDTACQAPIDVPADAGSVQFRVAAARAPGPPLEVLVRTDRGIVGRDTVPGGYGSPVTASASPAGIESGERIAVCVRNAGARSASVYGGGELAARTSSLRFNGRESPVDLALVFERAESRSMLAALPDAIERAALFRPGWVSTGLLWAVGLLLVTALPGALALALRSALSAPAPPQGEGPGRANDYASG
jgi:hypothetical protein